jgi:hypothetical protein
MSWNGTESQYVQVMTDAYIECALWSSLDDRGEPLDSSDALISESLRAESRIECQDFYTANAQDLADMNPEQAGHDFWLTRNGHGTGFWDRGLGELGNRLSESARIYGTVYLTVDDGEIVGSV